MELSEYPGGCWIPELEVERDRLWKAQKGAVKND